MMSLEDHPGFPLNFTPEQLTTPYSPLDEDYATPEEQLANAYHIVEACDAVLENTRPPSVKVAEHYDRLTSHPWLGDVTRSLISNGVLTVEPAGLNLAEEEAFNHKNDYALAIAGLLRYIAPHKNRLSMISVHHGPLPRTNQPVAPNLPRNLRISATRLAEGGALRQYDTPGRQFAFIPSENFNDSIGEGEDFFDQLRNSDWGKIDIDPNNQPRFMSLPELNAVTQVWPELPKHGRNIILKTNVGEESITTSHARALQKAFRDPKQNHLVLSDSQPMHFYENVFGLLRATETMKHHQFHIVTSALSNYMGQDQFTHLMGNKFREHAQRFVDVATKFSHFKHFKPKDYVDRNYGQAEAMLDDKNICRIVSFALSKLGVKDARVADIGCGPNPYPAMLLAPFARSIDLLEFSEPNRDYMTGFLGEQLPDPQMQIWPKFGGHMVEGGGTPYVNVMDRLLHMASESRVKVQFGNIFDLPQKRWKVVSQYFVDDSISIYRSDHREAVASMCEAIEAEGLIVSGNMLNDKDHVGYTAGDGTVFPNISQNVIELKQAYTDNKMFSLVIETAGTEKAREGYNGMAVVLAAHLGTAMHQKLEALKPQLKAMGFTVL